MAITTIQVSVEVRDELRLRGHLGETYDDVIRRLLLATRGRESPIADHSRRPLNYAPRSPFPRQELP